MGRFNKTRWNIFLITCTLPCFFNLLAIAQEVKKSPGEMLVDDFLVAVNSTDQKVLNSFCESQFKTKDKKSVLRRIAQFKQLSTDMGKIELEQVTSPEANRVMAICKTVKGPSLAFDFELEGSKPVRIASFSITSFDNPEDLRPVFAEERAKIIERIAKELDENYVFPDVGTKMSGLLQKNLKDGKYDDIENVNKFAQVLTDHLQDLCADKHLRVRAGVGRPRLGGNGRPDNSRSNFGFVKVEVLPGNIGYIKFNMFDPTQPAQDVAAAAMKFVENTDALIFDLRENGGGSPVMIAFLQTYLFDNKVHLNSFYYRPTDSTSESWTLDEIPGKRYGEKKPVYVLTSSYTFSGAEEFSYNLKHLKRGTIVGETTGGGAHPVRMVRLGDRMRMSVPFARAINPITKTNWEGSGVIPHVSVRSEEALEKAIEIAKEAVNSQSNTANDK